MKQMPTLSLRPGRSATPRTNQPGAISQPAASSLQLSSTASRAATAFPDADAASVRCTERCTQHCDRQEPPVCVENSVPDDVPDVVSCACSTHYDILPARLLAVLLVHRFTTCRSSRSSLRFQVCGWDPDMWGFPQASVTGCRRFATPHLGRCHDARARSKAPRLMSVSPI